MSRGIDGVSIEDFKRNEEIYIDDIYRRLQGGFFHFDPLFSYKQYKKGKKKPRDIQAPTIKDRIVQKIINDYLIEKYFRNDFNKIGIVGSVKGTTVRDVLKKILSFYENGYIYILKTDIVDYFPSIRIKRIKKIIDHYIKNKTEKAFLIEYLGVSKLPGIPQGPALSPLMANLYLRQLDNHLSKQKTIQHIRYVDDVLIFCKTGKRAKKACDWLIKKMVTCGLTIHPLGSSKTLIGRLNEGKIDMLGVIYKDGRLLIKKEKFKKFIEETISPLSQIGNLFVDKRKTIKESFNDLIQKLNYQIAGWGESYSFCDIKEEYQKLDKKIEENFLKLFKNIEDKKGIRYTDTRKRRILSKVKKLSTIKLKKIH